MSAINITVRQLEKSMWSLDMVQAFYRQHPLYEVVQKASGQFAAMNGMLMDFFCVEVDVDQGRQKGIFGPVDRNIAIAITAAFTNVTFTNLEDFERNAREHSKADPAIAAKMCGAVNCAFRDAEEKDSDSSSIEIITSIPCYASMITISVDGPETENIARLLAEQNFWGQKWHLPEGAHAGDEGLDRNLRRLEKIRSAVGNDTQLMVEAHGRWTPAYLEKFIERSRDFNITWIEDPLLPEHHGDYGLFKNSGTPICIGEKFTGVRDFSPFIGHDSTFVIQADVVDCGGYDAAKQVQSWCRDNKKLLTFHGKRLIPSLHLAATAATALDQVIEFNPIFEPERQIAMKQRIIPENGRLQFHSKDWNGLRQREY